MTEQMDLLWDVATLMFMVAGEKQLKVAGWEGFLGTAVEKTECNKDITQDGAFSENTEDQEICSSQN